MRLGNGIAASRRGKGLHSRRLLGTVSALALSVVVLGAGIREAHAVECVTNVTYGTETVTGDPANAIPGNALQMYSSRGPF